MAATPGSSSAAAAPNWKDAMGEYATMASQAPAMGSTSDINLDSQLTFLSSQTYRLGNAATLGFNELDVLKGQLNAYDTTLKQQLNDYDTRLKTQLGAYDQMIRDEASRMTDAIKAETYSNELGGSGPNAPTLGSKADTIANCKTIGSD